MPRLPPLRSPPSEPPTPTRGPLGAAVWALAWPTLVTNVLLSATGLINLIFVGRLGKDALAVVGMSEQFVFLLFSIVTSVSVGTSALVARSIGAEDLEQAEAVSRQSLVMCLLGGLLSTLLMRYLGPAVLKVMNAQGAILATGSEYLRILSWLQIQVFAIIVVGAIYRGFGDSRTPMYIMLATNAVQIAADFCLIYGRFGCPKMGVLGAAWSWWISRTLGGVLSVVLLARSPLSGCLKGDWRPDWSWFRRVWAIGLPTAIQQTVRTTASMVFFGILGHLPNGAASVAALTIGLRIESIAFMPGFAFGMSAITMVGQNLGAKQVDRAERAGWICAWQAMAMMGAAGVLFLTVPRFILHLFTSDPEVVPLGVGYLRANGLAQPALSLGIALTGAMQGAGETRIPAWITFVTMWVIRVPLTHLLADRAHMGTNVAWAVQAFTNILYGVAIVFLYRSGRWKRNRI